VNCIFNGFFSYCQSIFIALDVYIKLTGKIVRVYIHSLFCVLSFVLPACRPNFAEVVHTTLKIEQACIEIYFHGTCIAFITKYYCHIMWIIKLWGAV
jgi:hypothetical protein